MKFHKKVEYFAVLFFFKLLPFLQKPTANANAEKTKKKRSIKMPNFYQFIFDYLM